MATLNLKGIARLVQDQAAAIQAASASLVDFSVGSVLRAFVEANAGVAVWLQALVLKVLAASRLATSTGSDVDSFIADFGLTRLPAAAAAGQLTFSRYTATNPTVVPLGATAQTQDGTQVFKVVADAANPAYSPAAGGYPLAAGTPSVNASVLAVTPGAAANVAANTVITMTTPISGVDLVTNATPLAGGAAAETDAAVKVRFVKYILGLSRGDAYGVGSALANLNVGLTYTLTDQYSYSGAFQPGYFYVVVDDGSGSPSAAFLAAASNAVQAVKPLGAWFGIFAPIITTANVSLNLTTLPGYDHNTVVAQVATLISANIVALGLGAGLPYTQLSAWAYSVAGVSNVSAILLNGGSADIAPNNQKRIMPGTVAVV